jgi:hypothetical protein
MDILRTLKNATRQMNKEAKILEESEETAYYSLEYLGRHSKRSCAQSVWVLLPSHLALLT